MQTANGVSSGMAIGLAVVLLVVLVLFLGAAPVGNEGRPIIDIGLFR